MAKIPLITKNTIRKRLRNYVLTFGVAAGIAGLTYLASKPVSEGWSSIRDSYAQNRIENAISDKDYISARDRFNEYAHNIRSPKIKDSLATQIAGIHPDKRKDKIATIVNSSERLNKIKELRETYEALGKPCPDLTKEKYTAYIQLLQWKLSKDDYDGVQSTLNEAIGSIKGLYHSKKDGTINAMSFKKLSPQLIDGLIDSEVKYMKARHGKESSCASLIDYSLEFICHLGVNDYNKYVPQLLEAYADQALSFINTPIDRDMTPKVRTMALLKAAEEKYDYTVKRINVDDVLLKQIIYNYK